MFQTNVIFLEMMVILIFILHYNDIDIDNVDIYIDIIIYIDFVDDIDIDIGNDNAYGFCVRWGCLATLPPAL